MNEHDTPPPESIAIIGMSGRFPGAANPDEFWQLLTGGIDAIEKFDPSAVEFTCATPADLAAGRQFVRARGVLADADMFDAGFFGIYPKEAEAMDPQHRVFLECAWKAIESAGHDPAVYPGLIGVYAGLSLNTYLLWQLGKARDLAGNYQVGEYQTMLGNDKDFLPVRVSYKLNLRGPSMSVQCACSTSLVAICQAATALLTYQCDMALAGGVSISFPQRRDYPFEEDGMVSADGECRAFDAGANGTIFGHGCGVVLLKRLSDAMADGDPVLGVIRGWAVNNDGSDKIGFAAPSVKAQAEVIAMAQAAAGVAPEEVSYIEAHGTGTPLGDPIEITALTDAFRSGGATANQYCPIGTGKTHIGHLDVAAGATGVIKTLLQFQHEHIPALRNFTAPNPRIDFAHSPFFPVARPMPWPRGEKPRIAGVSAFGVGGTNAHVVLEEPPLRPASGPGRPVETLVLSARTPTALDAMTRRLADHLDRHPEQSIADVAWTLAAGRKRFACRRAVAATNPADAAAALRAAVGRDAAVVTGHDAPPVVFLFPGQGAQFVGMGQALYQTEPDFRAAVDECADHLLAHLGVDVRRTLFPDDADRAAAETRIHETWLTQPAIFTIEWAMARLWIARGVRPSMVIGHSIGEYVAAVLAGVFTLPDALRLLSARAKLMMGLPAGSMLAVRLSAGEVAGHLPDTVAVAAVNSPKLCTVSGPTPDILALQSKLDGLGVAARLLPTSHAFHSIMMEPILDAFTAEAAMIPVNAPSLPWISTCTGRAMDAATLADPAYWSRQLRQPVLFADALEMAFSEQPAIVLECGPGQALAQFARQHPAKPATLAVVASLPGQDGGDTAARDHANAMGQIWSHGVEPDWSHWFGPVPRLRLVLPTYPFERQRHWVDAPAAALPAAGSSTTPTISLPSATPTLAAMTTPITPTDRRPDLAAKLRALVQELSGLAVTDDRALFTELGFDSLFLTQASQAVHTRFGVKVTFRQLLDDLGSIEKLSAHLDATMPAEARAPAPAQPAASVPVAASPVAVPAGSSTLEQLVASNLQILQTLLAERGSNQSVASASAAAPASRLPVVRWPDGGAPAPTAAAGVKRFGPYKPVEKGDKGGLTPRQQSALDGIIARYTARTAKSKAYTAGHRAHFADPRAVAGFKSMWKEMVYPVVAAGSKGSRITDIDGNEYVDITMGFGTYFFGHSPDWLVEALQAQLHTGMEIGPQSPLAGDLARKICQFTGMERATFCNTGSEAVMAAIRLARTITGRDRVVYFTGDYHGMFEEVLVRGSWVDGVYRAQPISPGIPASLVENMLVLDYAAPESLEILRAHAGEIAAVLVEPVQSRQPDLQPREFMHALREITAAHGAALIFDEVVTGFRCHPGGAQAYFGVQADMATYGKVVGGGLPIGVLAGTSRFMDALDGGAWSYGDDSFPEVGVTFFAGTFVRHPLAMAAATRVMQHLLDRGPALQQEMTERVGRFCTTLNHWLAARGVPIRVPHFSAFAVIEHAPDLKFASLLWYLLREKGIHVWEGRPLYFTEAHSDEDFDRILAAFQESVVELQAAGFLPEAPVAVSSTTPEPLAFPRVETAPTTEAQREIFLSVQMGDEANCAFNESNVIWFDGTLDPRALSLAIHDLLTRHHALRSTFTVTGDEQIFHPVPSPELLPVIDWSLDPAGQRDAAWAALLADGAGTPFDLTHGPLTRFHLVRHSAARHALVFTAHHLVCDGWSFGMLMAELATAYNARRAGFLPMLPPAMPFAEYARLEVAAKGSPEQQAAEAFWVGQFAGGAPVLDLPTDFPRPPVKTHHGAMATRVMDPERFQRLKTSAPKIGGTVFSTLLGAFATLIHRLTGQDDVVIGVPAAGQTMVGRDELIGHCLNFLPLRLRPDAAMSFDGFARSVKNTVLEAYDHQAYTFGSLLKKLDLPRDTSRLPLVNVMFNIDKSGLDQVAFDGLQFEVETNAKRHVNFELFFNLVQSDHRMILECEYNTDLFERATIDRWLASFETLIEGVMRDPGQSLATLPILDAAEETLLLDIWNATAADYPRDATALCLIEGVAARVPDRPAVVCGDDRLDYRTLIERATILAARLQAHGVKPGDLVGIHLQRSTGLVAGLLAIWKCGAAYVPMDPAFPADRLRFMVEDARMPVILTESAIYRDLPATTARLMLIDELAPKVLPFQAVDIPSSATAYVIFTSGSTGRPKGVRISHRALVNFLNSMRKQPGLNPDDVLLSVTTLSFDIAGLEIFLPLTTGARVVLAKRETAMDGHLLSKAIEEQGITVLQATPATWRLLLEASWSGSRKLKALVGGEAVPRDLVNRLAGLTGELWNVYGPTETTIWSTTIRLDAGDGPVMIGKPIDNTTVYVVSSTGALQPIGVPGELWIGGDGLAEGYHERPDLTADRFIPSPFRAGEKLYRTGDLARWTSDGQLECLGRMDNQVKVRGFRIELGEIEAALESHPAVAQAVAHVHDGRLVAYARTAVANDGTALWKDQWDMLYSSAIAQSGTGKLDQLDAVIAGWAGAENIDDQVSEWIQTTVARLAPLATGKVLEIGCGTGQLLARLAPSAAAYWAADISKVAIDALQAQGQAAHVKLFHRPADDFSGWPEAEFDTVIINSVAQYFPDADYLARVLAGAMRMLKPDGRIFLGDIQGHALLPVHHAEALRERAPAGATVGEFRALVANRVARESELCLDPAWFHQWARAHTAGHVEFHARRGKLINETTAYHYDVLLHRGHPAATVAVPASLDWKKHHLNLEQVEAMLAEHPDVLALSGIPDARLARPILFHHALAFADTKAPVPAWPSGSPGAITADDLHVLAEGAGYQVHVRWEGDGSGGTLEAVFLPANHPAVPLWPNGNLGSGPWANTPVATGNDRGQDLTAALRAHLATSLPDYMIPSAMVFLDAFPLTPNGKVDRKALPAPTGPAARAPSRELVAPRDGNESRLLEIWKEVLGNGDIGVTDDIFSLGADSILIFQMTTRATRAGLAITPALVFRHRTVAALAGVLASAGPAAPSTPTTIQRVNRDAYRRKS